MIAGLDSSFFRPSVAQLQQAKAAGVRVWGGYLTTRPNVGIASPWDQVSFERVRAALGTTPIAWASGWDDPVACKQKAAAWNVRLGLDDESGIRVGLTPLEEQHVKRRIANRGPRRLDGSWVQSWLDASGAGLYGNAPVFNGRRAPFFVIAAYPASGDPGRSWPASAALPQVPCGWQWAGTHDEFGGGVDRGWYDDWFLGAADPAPIISGGGMIAYDPKNPSDVYQVTIGINGHFYGRKGWDQGLADVNWGDLSTPAAPAFVPLSASIAVKPDGGFYTLEAVGLDGSLWSSVRAADGKVLQDWKANLGTAALPGGAPGPAGPAGPAYDDTQLRGDVQQLKDRVAQVAKVLS